MPTPIQLPEIFLYRGKRDSRALSTWPSGAQTVYDFNRGDLWINKDGWSWAGGARTIVTEAGTGQEGARYQYAGGNDPFGDGSPTPEQYFSITDGNEYGEFWFKRRIFIPSNYVHRRTFRLTLDDITGWQVGDQVYGKDASTTGEIKYISGNRIALKNVVGYQLGSTHWIGTVTNVTRGTTATCTATENMGNNNKFQVFYCDGYSALGDSPTVVIELCPNVSDSGTNGTGDWDANGSTIRFTSGVNRMNSDGSYILDGNGNKIRRVTQNEPAIPNQPFILPSDYGTWIDTVYYYKMSTTMDSFDGIFIVWKKPQGASSYTKIMDCRTLDMGERPGAGKFRNGYMWGWANSGYEQPTLFIDSEYMLSTTAIDGCTP